MNAAIELAADAIAPDAPAPLIAALPEPAPSDDLDDVHEQALIRLGRAGRASGQA